MKKMLQQMAYALVNQHPSALSPHIPVAIALNSGFKGLSREIRQEASTYRMPENASSGIKEDISKGFSGHMERAPLACKEAGDILESLIDNKLDIRDSFDLK